MAGPQPDFGIIAKAFAEILKFPQVFTDIYDRLNVLTTENGYLTAHV
jgi:hypothetical protein